jgi:hypothetical protein
MEDILIQMGLAALKTAIKDPKLAAKFQSQLVEVANDILTIFPPNSTT